MEFKDTNPKDAVGVRKWRTIACVPFTVLWEVGLGMLEGARKYGRHNYRVAGVRSSVYVEAAMGHIMQWWEGEDIDKDSGLSHITKAITSLVVLRDAMIQGTNTDDRPPKTDIDGLRDDLQKIMDGIFDRLPDAVDAYVEGDQTPKEHAFVIPGGADPNADFVKVDEDFKAQFPPPGVVVERDPAKIVADMIIDDPWPIDEVFEKAGRYTLTAAQRSWIDRRWVACLGTKWEEPIAAVRFDERAKFLEEWAIRKGIIGWIETDIPENPRLWPLDLIPVVTTAEDTTDWAIPYPPNDGSSTTCRLTNAQLDWIEKELQSGGVELSIFGHGAHPVERALVLKHHAVRLGMLK